MVKTNKIKAAGWGAKAALDTTHNKTHNNSLNLKAQRSFYRVHIPTPISYYKKQFKSITDGREWVNVNCCFHEDSNPSLSINLKSGGFICHACGAKGGDIIEFHRLRFNLGFNDAVEQLKKMHKGESN